MTSAGRLTRLSRLIPDRRSVLVPFDDALINGPYDGLVDTVTRAREVAAGGADAVMGFRALHDRCAALGLFVPFIVNLTASTVLASHTRKAVVGSVEGAVRAGCDGVAVHVNVTDRHEGEMLGTLGAVAEACQQWGMPLMAIMYPRRLHPEGTDDNYLELKATDRAGYANLVRHAVRIAVELGADIVKTQYTGDPESFATVVEASMGVPVVIAGGPRTSIREALDNAHGAVSAGAAGVCFGRQTYHRTDVAGFVRKLCLVVRDRHHPADLMPA
jgi:DhnA family fructose-bisphosphate aldolase class Ia